MAIERTGVELVAEDADAFESAIDSAAGAMSNFESVGAAATDSFNGFEEIITGALRRVGEIAIDFALNAGQALIDFGKDSFEGALDAEKGLTKLKGAIKRAGDQAPITEQKALELSQSLKHLAGGSDDAVIAAESVLLKFQSIGEETFPQALQTSLDLAAIMGTDVTSAAEQLGRALGNPEAASRLLRQAGIFLTDQEKEQIKTFIEAGDQASAQQLLLEKLATTTAGAAEQMAGTVGGQMAIFKETIADAGEQIATAFLPILQELFDNVIKPALPIIEQLAEGIALAIGALVEGDVGGAFDTLGEFFNNILPGSAEIFYALGGFVEDMIESFASGQSPIQSVIDALINLRDAFIDQMPEMQRVGEDLFAFLQEAFGDTLPSLITNVTSIINSLAEIWREHGDEIMAIVSFVFKVVVATILGAINLVTGIIAAGLQLIQGDWVGAFNTLGATLESFFNSALAIVGTNMDEFRAVWGKNFQMLGVIVEWALDNVINTLAGWIGNFINIGHQFVDGIRQGIIDGVAGIIDAANWVADQAVAAWQNIWDSRSPSRVAMEEMGMPITQGIAQGIIAAMGDVRAALGMVSVSALDASGNNASYNNSIANTRNYNLTVNSAMNSQEIASDFSIMQAMA